MIWIGLQIITGILARVIQYSPKIMSNLCILTKRVHYISSYLIIILAKFNYLNAQYYDHKIDRTFFILITLDIILLIIYLFIKFNYWTLSEEIIDNQLVDRKISRTKNVFYYSLQYINYSSSNLLKRIKKSTFDIP